MIVFGKWKEAIKSLGGIIILEEVAFVYLMLQVPTMPSSVLYRKPCKKQHRQHASKEDREEKQQKAKRVWGNEGHWEELWSGANTVGLHKTSATTSWGQPQRGPEHSDKLGLHCSETSHGRLQAAGRQHNRGEGRQRSRKAALGVQRDKDPKSEKRDITASVNTNSTQWIIHAFTIILTKLHWKLKPPKMSKEVKSNNNNRRK